jgi:hypothetical protein
MPSALRKLGLTAHLISSLGWLGAVASFLVLSIAGLTSRNAETVRGAYVAMNLIGQFIIVPLSLAALLTGVVQSLGTHWGLFRYYWVLVKLALTIGATSLMLLHQLTAVAEAARRVSTAAAGTFPEVGRRLSIQLVGDAGGAVVVLLVITALGVYKPWGRTPYGRRKQQEERRPVLEGTPASALAPPGVPGGESTDDRFPMGLKIVLAVMGVIVAAFVALHLAGGGFGPHGH